MGKLIDPSLKKDEPIEKVHCAKCGMDRPARFFATTKNTLLFPSGRFPICNDCARRMLKKDNFSWETMDKLCRYLDIPFIPKKYEELHEANGDDVFAIYAEVFSQGDYATLGWKEFNDKFIELKDAGEIEREVPLLDEEELARLRDKWGANYDEEELRYLEKLYEGLLASQNVTGALNGDQALKMCKISLLIDQRIREGEDIDKLLRSYDSLVKIAGFTPKNSKNINDFDSIGEIVHWLEKRGWKNPFYDGVTRDIVDETIKNFQNYNRRLYINETGIGDQITERINSLKHVDEMEGFYDTNLEDIDYDDYETEIYKAVDAFEDDEESVDMGGITNV